MIIKTRYQARASKIDLNAIKMSNLPNQLILKQIQIASCDSKQGTLSKINPFPIAREINEICGEVENIEHRRSILELPWYAPSSPSYDFWSFRA